MLKLDRIFRKDPSLLLYTLLRPPCPSYSKNTLAVLDTGTLTPIPTAIPTSVLLKSGLISALWDDSFALAKKPTYGPKSRYQLRFLPKCQSAITGTVK